MHLPRQIPPGAPGQSDSTCWLGLGGFSIEGSDHQLVELGNHCAQGLPD
jgi:hypothetical protein